MTIIESLKSLLQERIYTPKTVFLEERLKDVLVNPGKYYESERPLDAFQFEFDMPMEFRYVGYPALEEGWKGFKDNVMIDLSESDDYQHQQFVLTDFYEEFNTNEEKIDEWYWISLKELELSFFIQCWQRAKNATGSKIRCFFMEHDTYRGVDCDTGSKVSSNNIEGLITNET